MTQDPQALQKTLKYITSLQNKNKSATKIEWQTEKMYFQPVTQSALFPSIQKTKEKFAEGINWPLTREEVQMLQTHENILNFAYNKKNSN